MSGLRNLEEVLHGTCDGRPASATVTRARYGGTRGRLVLRGGGFTREVPPTFLNGGVLSSGFKSTGLACDGRRLQLHALALRADAHGEIVMDKQDATLDLRTGELSMTALTTLSPAATRAEFR